MPSPSPRRDSDFIGPGQAWASAFYESSLAPLMSGRAETFWDRCLLKIV